MYHGASWGHYVNQEVKKTRKHKALCSMGFRKQVNFDLCS